MSKLLAVGAQMPDVSLKGKDGPVSLRGLVRPGGLVVYFYPRDDTPGCTVESCHFRDQYEDFVGACADVVGISSDSAESHEKFKAKHRLPFTLLTDEKNAARQAFGVGNTLGFLPGRVTFVFDGQGVCRYAFDSQLRVHAHVERALEEIRKISPQPKA